MVNRDIITIGASAGGVETLMKLVAGPPADLPASIFVVQHISPETPTALANILASRGPLPAVSRLEEIGDLVPMTCAECGGPLWAIRGDNIAWFRCKEGHSYTARALALGLSETVERSLWVAVQTMDERTRMLDRLAMYEHEKGRERSAISFAERAREAGEHANHLRQLLLAVNQ